MMSEAYQSTARSRIILVHFFHIFFVKIFFTTNNNVKFPVIFMHLAKVAQNWHTFIWPVGHLGNARGGGVLAV